MLQKGKTYEEMVVGSLTTTARRTVTETDLVNFITLCGFNEPLFYDAAYAKSIGYPGRLCPGALTFAIAEGLILQTQEFPETGIAFLGMRLHVKKPVFVNDTIHAVAEVEDIQPTSSGTKGIVTWRVSVYNQSDEEVLVYFPKRLLRGKNSESSAS